jgi:diacylglycerol kinase
MKNKKKFSIPERILSFKHAFNGLKILFNYEHNAQIHLAAAILVIIAGFLFKISSIEWMAIIIVAGMVFMAEIFNSAIELISDFISPTYHEVIKKVKDLSAAAVLVSALMALIVGAIVFIPKVVSF